ncbi:MAG: hypothetical protein CMK00_06955 [Planctomycetes bacterium]|jgi:hypothetical protein|nr:hypothetical protein [Planctomycetota bacterium]HJO26687.1 zinc dependent phospholipase C family protein [Planctomycetota bacterium]
MSNTLLPSALLAVASAAGLSTHFQMADMTTVAVDETTHGDLVLALQEHPQAFRAGSVFPDWGYLREPTRDLAEAAHWPPFQEAALAWFLQEHPGPWGAAERELLTFLLGVICHGETDEAWHFGSTAFLTRGLAEDLPTWEATRGEGLIEAGVDIFVQVEDRPGAEERDWYLPVEALVQIYHSLGHTDATALDMIIATRAQRLGLYLEDTAGWLLYLYLRLTIPWCHDNYMDHYDGGLANGAELTARRLEDTWDALLGRRPADSPWNGEEHQPHGACARGVFVELAGELLAAGAADVPVRRLPDGSARLGMPRILDRAALTRGLESLPARLR